MYFNLAFSLNKLKKGGTYSGSEWGLYVTNNILTDTIA